MDRCWVSSEGAFRFADGVRARCEKERGQGGKCDDVGGDDTYETFTRFQTLTMDSKLILNLALLQYSSWLDKSNVYL